MLPAPVLYSLNPCTPCTPLYLHCRMRVPPPPPSQSASLCSPKCTPHICLPCTIPSHVPHAHSSPHSLLTCSAEDPPFSALGTCFPCTLPTSQLQKGLSVLPNSCTLVCVLPIHPLLTCAAEGLFMLSHARAPLSIRAPSYMLSSLSLQKCLSCSPSHVCSPNTVSLPVRR